MMILLRRLFKVCKYLLSNLFNFKDRIRVYIEVILSVSH